MRCYVLNWSGLTGWLAAQAARDSGTDPSLWYNGSRLALKQGRLFDARQALEAALDVSPRHDASAILLQEVLFQLRDLPTLDLLSNKCALSP